MAVGESVLVLCDCGKRLKAPPTAVGRRVRCPACGAAVAVGATMTTAARATAAPAAPVRQMAAAATATDDGLGALYELAEQARTAATAAESPRCPGCRSAMATDAVLCTNCGYDTRTGRSLATAVEPSARPAARPAVGGRRPQVDYMAPQGSLMVGVAMSAMFGVAASILWVAMVATTGYTISYLAILIGWAAGAGMKVGQKGFSTAGGGAAAAVTVATILVAKLVSIELYLALHHAGRTVSDLSGATLGWYFFNPFGLIIMAIGMGAAFRTANGSITG